MFAHGRCLRAQLCDYAAMIEADWGVHAEPSSFGPHASEWEPIGSDSPEDVLEVMAARAHDYSPAPEASVWCFIPAIWPQEARAWVRDSRVRHLTRQCDGRPVERLPWTTADYVDHEKDTNALLAELGLPARPAGRIWLLRAREPYASAQEVLDDIWAGWQSSGGPAMASPEFAQYAQSRLHEVF
jgi:hypothetical protein